MSVNIDLFVYTVYFESARLLINISETTKHYSFLNSLTSFSTAIIPLYFVLLHKTLFNNMLKIKQDSFDYFLETIRAPKTNKSSLDYQFY